MLFRSPLNPQGNHEAVSLARLPPPTKTAPPDSQPCNTAQTLPTQCGACPGIPALPDSAHNFTEYKARFHSVALNSNTGNNRFYSFNKGLT